MRLSLLAPVLLAAVGLAAGCQTGAKPLDLNQRAEYRALKKKVGSAVPVRLGIDVRDSETPAGKISDKSFRVSADRARIARTLRRYIKDLGVVNDVAEGAEGAGAVLEIRPLDQRVSYQGFNNYVYGNAALLFFAGAAAWWVPDETWVADLGWEVVLKDARGAEIVAVPVDVKHQHELSDFDRGFDWMSALFLWGFAPDTTSFAEAGKILMPQAEADATLRVCEQLASGPLHDALQNIGAGPIEPGPGPGPGPGPEVGPTPVTPTRQAVRRAICMGVEIDTASVAPDTVAVTDTSKAANLVGETPIRATRDAADVLTGADATADNLRKRLDALKALELTRDDLIVFVFAGRGTVLADGRPAIVCDDGDPASGDKCVALADIQAAVTPAKLICFIDASFNGWAETRGPGVEVPDMALPNGWGSATDTIVFVAAKSGSAEVQFVDDPAGAFETGVFSGGVRSLLAGGGDRNGDGILTAGEASEFLARHVEQNRGATAQADPTRLAGASDARLWTVR